MNNPGVRMGVCPKSNFLQYRIDLERNGYKVLSTKELNDGIQDVVHFEYQKVNNVAKQVMYSQ